MQESEKSMLNKDGFYFIDLTDKSAIIHPEPSRGYFSLLAAIFEEDKNISFGDGSLITYRCVLNNSEMYFAKAIDTMLNGLTDRESTIIRKRFGLTDGKRHTLDEVGHELNLTRERIRQIEKRAMHRLRQPSSSRRFKLVLFDSQSNFSDFTSDLSVIYSRYFESIIRDEIEYILANERLYVFSLLFGKIYIEPKSVTNMLDYFDEDVDEKECIKNSRVNEIENSIRNNGAILTRTGLCADDMSRLLQKGMFYIDDFLESYDDYARDGFAFNDDPNILFDESITLPILIRYSTPILRIRIPAEVQSIMNSKEITTLEQLEVMKNSFPEGVRNQADRLIQKVSGWFGKIEKPAFLEGPAVEISEEINDFENISKNQLTEKEIKSRELQAQRFDAIADPEKTPSEPDTELVTLLCDNSMQQEVLQKFGPNTEVRKKKNNRQFIAKVRVSPAPCFFAWVFQCEGRVRIEDPASVLKQYSEMITVASGTTTPELSRITQDLFNAVQEISDGTEITPRQLLKNCGYNPDEFDEDDLAKYHEALLHRIETSNLRYRDFSLSSEPKELALVLSEPENTDTAMLWDLNYYVFNREKRPLCPFCGDSNTARILYGKPALHDGLREIIESGRLASGGCLRKAVVREDGSMIYMDPLRHCNHCDRDFAHPAFWQEKDHLEKYADVVKAIKIETSRSFTHTTWTIKENEKGAVVKYYKHDAYDRKPESFKKQITSQEWMTFLHKLYNETYLHEWEKEYGQLECDGWGWNIEVILEGNFQQNYCGHNCTPPYWDKLIRLVTSFREGNRPSLIDFMDDELPFA